MGGIRRIRRWIFILIVFVFIIILFFMKTIHSVSKRKISKSHFLLDVDDKSKIDSCSQFREMATRDDEKQTSSNFTRQSAGNSTKASNNSVIPTLTLLSPIDVSTNTKPIHGQLDIKKALKWFSTQKDYLKDDKLNKHNFFYQLTSKLCFVKKLSVVILVHSAVNNARNRQLIRYTWGSVNTIAIQPIIIFMLGESFPENKTLQLEIEKESRQYGDIVQGDFLDTYKNLTYKHVMAIHWVTTHCDDDVRTIVKIDDDVFVDVYKLVRFSIAIGHFPNTIYCHVENRPLPARTGRWALSTNEYPFPFSPRYCDGMAYIFSMGVAKKLLKASENVAFFWIDDVYVTGLLAMKAGIGHKKFGFGHDGFLMRRQKTCNLKDILTRFMFYAHLRDWDTFSNLLSGKNG